MQHHTRRFALALGLLLAALPLTVAAVPAAATTPPLFADEPVLSAAAPTDLAFTPDGRLLVTTQGGQLLIYLRGELLPTPALDLVGQICANIERGLLGVAVDPAFTTNRTIFLYYTHKTSAECVRNAVGAPVNRVARFILRDDNRVDPASEQVLIDNIPSPNANHNAGDLGFGRDGYLYITVGDGGCDYAGDSGCAGANDAARDRHVLLGKVLRITRDGGIPPDNPFQGPDSARCHQTGRAQPGQICQEAFALGLRNPFRLAIDPNASTTRVFVNDVGQGKWEEINELRAAADYGWSIREGNCRNNSETECGPPPAGLSNPLFAYPHGQCNSITGGAFVPNGLWPGFTNIYLYADYVCGTIFKLVPNGQGGYSASEFVTGMGNNSAVALAFGPYNGVQALYYTSYANGGQVRRVRYTGVVNRAPTAQIAAQPTNGPAPLLVTFDASASSDPDGDPLSYRWDFGDGTTASGITTTHTFAPGTFFTELTVADSQGALAPPARLRIDSGNTAPQPTILSPATSQTFAVNEQIVLRGSANDPEDGPLPDSALRWTVILHHADHTHPFLEAVGNNLTLSAPAPEDLLATTNSYLEVVLTATDARGLSSTLHQELRPQRVAVTFATEPAGRYVAVNGFAVTGPQTVTSWPGYQLHVDAPDQNDEGGYGYQFVTWSDGAPASHTIVTPQTTASYTATYQVVRGPVQPPWLNRDIGAVGLAGGATASYLAPHISIRASGVDIWGRADSFHFVAQPLSGDGSITTRVMSLDATNPWAKAGVMIREGLNADARHAFLALTASKGVSFQRRTSTGGNSASSAGSKAVAPTWLRLVRRGNQISAYESYDGLSWKQVGVINLTMARDVYIGLALTSHTNMTLTNATFEAVNVTR